MLKHFRNRKGQNTAEYAILIALVVGGVIAMQTYAQRALQGRIRDASVQLRTETSDIGNTLQYEPYYLNTQSEVDKYSSARDTYEEQTRRTDSTKSSTGSWDRTEYLNGTVDNTGVSEPGGF